MESLQPPNVTPGTAEWSILRRAYWLVETMQRLEQAVKTGDEQKTRLAISGVEYCLRDMRRVLRDVASEVQAIKGKPPAPD